MHLPNGRTARVAVTAMLSLTFGACSTSSSTGPDTNATGQAGSSDGTVAPPGASETGRSVSRDQLQSLLLDSRQAGADVKLIPLEDLRRQADSLQSDSARNTIAPPACQTLLRDRTASSPPQPESEAGESGRLSDGVLLTLRVRALRHDEDFDSNRKIATACPVITESQPGLTLTENTTLVSPPQVSGAQATVGQRVIDTDKTGTTTTLLFSALVDGKVVAVSLERPDTFTSSDTQTLGRVWQAQVAKAQHGVSGGGGVFQSGEAS